MSHNDRLSEALRRLNETGSYEDAVRYVRELERADLAPTTTTTVYAGTYEGDGGRPSSWSHPLVLVFSHAPGLTLAEVVNAAEQAVEGWLDTDEGRRWCEENEGTLRFAWRGVIDAMPHEAWSSTGIKLLDVICPPARLFRGEPHLDSIGRCLGCTRLLRGEPASAQWCQACATARRQGQRPQVRLCMMCSAPPAISLDEDGLCPRCASIAPTLRPTRRRRRRVQVCTWCPQPHNPDPQFHPGGQAEHVS